MIPIIYEDEDIIVVQKPAGVPSQKDLTGDEDVYSMVCDYTGLSTVGLLQRLDRPVGGLMVMALSEEAKRIMTNQIKDREIDKYYMAVVHGKARKECTLNNYIRKVRGNRAVLANKKVDGYKTAVLQYRCIHEEETEDGPVSFLKVKLETGRFHQIRAQLAHNKLPILGDTKYNAFYKDKRGWYKIGLFAYRLDFIHPTTKKKLTFDCQYTQTPFDLFEGHMAKLKGDTL